MTDPRECSYCHQRQPTETPCFACPSRGAVEGVEPRLEATCALGTPTEGDSYTLTLPSNAQTGSTGSNILKWSVPAVDLAADPKARFITIASNLTHQDVIDLDAKIQARELVLGIDESASYAQRLAEETRLLHRLPFAVDRVDATCTTPDGSYDQIAAIRLSHGVPPGPTVSCAKRSSPASAYLNSTQK